MNRPKRPVINVIQKLLIQWHHPLTEPEYIGFSVERRNKICFATPYEFIYPLVESKGIN